MSKISIFGGGPAGLSVAYYAKKVGLEFTVYEANDVTGGNCRTIHHGDFRFDTGAHRLHDKSSEVVSEIMDLLGDDLKKISTPSYIFHNGRFIHFPLTPFELLLNLTPMEGIKALGSFLLKNSKNEKINNFREFANAKYGKTVADLFLNNYSEKLWGLPTDKLSPNISGSRLKNLNLRNLMTEFIFPKRKAKHMEGTFYYPQNGFGQIVESLGDYIGSESISLNSRVTKIFHDNSRITKFEINNQELVHSDLIISSLPLPLLIKLLHPAPEATILELAKSFKFRHLTLFCFFLKKDKIKSAATIYFPSKAYPFTRGYEPKNRSLRMSPKNKTSFIVEVPHSELKLKENEEDLKKSIAEVLIKEQFFQYQDIIEVITYRIPFAYPVLEKDFELKVKLVNEYLSQFENLLSTGRSGKFEYSWTHDMMINGKSIIQEICQKEEFSGMD